MAEKVYSFTDEDGNVVRYKVKEQLSLNQNDYLVMCPENDNAHMEVYKFTEEALELVENPKELTMIKSASHVM